jgi:hypothetical protein
LTVAVAVVVDTPSAAILAGARSTVTSEASAHDGAARYQLNAVAATTIAPTAEKRKRSL